VHNRKCPGSSASLNWTFQPGQLSLRDLSGRVDDGQRVDRLFDISSGSNWRSGYYTFRNLLGHQRISPRWQTTTWSHLTGILLLLKRVLKSIMLYQRIEPRREQGAETAIDSATSLKAKGRQLGSSSHRQSAHSALNRILLTDQYWDCACEERDVATCGKLIRFLHAQNVIETIGGRKICRATVASGQGEEATKAKGDKNDIANKCLKDGGFGCYP
jgi:hypothetical protein